MAGLIVITHGRLADELVEATVRIVGPLPDFEAVSLGWDDDVSDARRRIDAAIDRLSAKGDVLVLTDMFGGTPTNLALSLLEPGKVEVVTGVNLPMLIKFANLRETDTPGATARRIAEQGRAAIHVASDLLEQTPSEPSETGS